MIWFCCLFLFLASYDGSFYLDFSFLMMTISVVCYLLEIRNS